MIKGRRLMFEQGRLPEKMEIIEKIKNIKNIHDINFCSFSTSNLQCIELGLGNIIQFLHHFKNLSLQISDRLYYCLAYKIIFRNKSINKHSGRSKNQKELTYLSATNILTCTGSHPENSEGEGLSLNPNHWLSHAVEILWQHGTQCLIAKHLPLNREYKTREFYYNNIKLTQYVNTFTSYSHQSKIIKLRTMHDIETNPGPIKLGDHVLNIITLNCRGLNKVDKLRLILSKSRELLNKSPNTIIMLQEVMIKDNSYIDYVWRGKYILTPGLGNSQGCLTLLDNDKIISNEIHIGNRGHICEIEGILENKICIGNIYAPTGYGIDKIDFFNNVIEKLELKISAGLQNILIGGDFNVTLCETDRLNRDQAPREGLVANMLSTAMTRLGLNDAWQGYDGLTWRRGTTMSRLDRIFYRLSGFVHTSTNIDWTFCESDHALVQACFLKKITESTEG
jgi:exonuclease III